jgi:exopolysaccharide production protein ExoQ
VRKLIRTSGAEMISLAVNLAVIFILLALFFRVASFYQVRRVLWHTPTLSALLLLAGASWFWSVAPAATWKGWILALKLTLIGLYLSQAYTFEEILEMLFGVAALAVVLSIIAVWFFPEIGTRSWYWQGVYSFKNFLGRIVAFANVLFVFYWWHKRGGIVRQGMLLGLVVISILLIRGSFSTTSMVAAVGMYAVLGLYFIWRKWGSQWGGRVAWGAGLFAVVLSGVVILQAERIFAMLGRSLSMVIRIDLWKSLLEMLNHQPVFGYGYNAFWKTLPSGILAPATNQTLLHAHNGYVETAMGLGAAGFLLFLVTLLIAWKRAFTLLAGQRQFIFMLPIISLTYFTLANIPYSIAFEFPDFHWLLFVMTLGMVSRGTDEIH